MSKNKVTVKILNPLKDGAGYTSLRRALHFVHSGYAEWVGKCIRFDEDWSQRRALDGLAAYIRRQKLKTMDQAGYDQTTSTEQATLDQMQGLPLAGPAERMIGLGSKRLPVRPPRCKVLLELRQ